MDFNQSAEKQTDYSYVRKIVDAALAQGGGHGIAAGGNTVQEWQTLLSNAARDAGAEFAAIPSALSFDELEDFLLRITRSAREADDKPLIIAVDASDGRDFAEKYSQDIALELSNIIGGFLEKSQNVVYVQMTEEGAGQFFLNTHRTHQPVKADKPQP